MRAFTAPPPPRLRHLLLLCVAGSTAFALLCAGASFAGAVLELLRLFGKALGHREHAWAWSLLGFVVLSLWFGVVSGVGAWTGWRIASGILAGRQRTSHGRIEPSGDHAE